MVDDRLVQKIRHQKPLIAELEAEAAPTPAADTTKATKGVPLSNITVKIKAVETETGRTVTTDERADVALADVDAQIQRVKDLIRCLNS